MKKFKQILVIVGLGSISSLAQADCSAYQSQENCQPPCMWSTDANGGAGGCVVNTGIPHNQSSTSKEAITSDAKTNKYNKKGQ